jgi:hypothetical protein
VIDDRPVHVVYRLAPTRKSEVRPPWFSQQACLRSFVLAVTAARTAGLRVRSTVVVDGDVPQLEADLAWFDERLNIQLRGNAPAFRFALDLAAAADEPVTFFAEDDYMWAAAAIVETVRALESVPAAAYASPYAHPVVSDRSLVDVRRHRERTFLVGETVWRSSPRTTMTFACRTAELRRNRHYWQLATYGRSPKDGYAFRALIDGRWFTLVGNAAFRDVRRVINGRTVRLIVECVVRRIRPSRRPRLVQPVDGLASHVHLPFITGALDWSALAREVCEAG